jgi:hypothetical protein
VLELATGAETVGDVVIVGDVVMVGVGAGSTGVGVGVGVSVGVGVVGTGAVSTGVGVGAGASGVVVGTTGFVVAAVSVIVVLMRIVESREIESLRIESLTCGVGFVGGLGCVVWADTIAGINAKPAAAPSSRSFIFPPFGWCE